MVPKRALASGMKGTVEHLVAVAVESKEASTLYRNKEELHLFRVGGLHGAAKCTDLLKDDSNFVTRASLDTAKCGKRTTAGIKQLLQIFSHHLIDYAYVAHEIQPNG